MNVYGLYGWLCPTLGPFDAELCLSEGGKSKVKYGEAARNGPREGQMENGQIEKRQTERLRESLSICLILSLCLHQSLSVHLSICLSIYLYHNPPLVSPSHPSLYWTHTQTSTRVRVNNCWNISATYLELQETKHESESQIIFHLHFKQYWYSNYDRHVKGELHAFSTSACVYCICIERNPLVSP